MQICFKCSQTISESNYKAFDKCEHIFCCKCLVEYLKIIQTNTVKCIFSECTAMIPDNIIRECLSNDQLLSYERLYKIGGLNKTEDDSTENSFINPDESTISDSIENSPIENENAVVGEEEEETLKINQRLEIERLYRDYNLLPNPNSFICQVCYEFILPRKGVILRNCLHMFCVDCLKGYMVNVEFINHMTCLDRKCRRKLTSSEILGILSVDRIVKMMKHEAASRFFQCKNENCPAMWEVVEASGSYVCPICDATNCLECEDIHTDSSCEEFRKTRRYSNPECTMKILDINRRIKCFICQNELIQDGGCGSLCCNNCGSHTCVFTGKICGEHIPELCFCNEFDVCSKVENFCNCSAKTPCHEECIYGCHPEDDF